MKHPSTRFILPTLLLALARAANADSTLEYRVAETGKTDRVQALLVKDGKVFAQGVADGGNIDLLYSSAPEQLSLIDHRKRNVMTLDESQANRLAKQAETVEPLLQGFAGQLAKLNPKQRAKWEELLGGHVSLEQIAATAKPALPAKIVKTGRSRTVAGVGCEQMNVFQGKEQMAAFCLASPAKLGLPNEDYTALRSLLNFSAGLAAKTQGLARQFGVDIPRIELGDLAGVPIELREMSSHTAMKLSRVATSALSAELLRIPEGYRNEPFQLWK